MKVTIKRAGGPGGERVLVRLDTRALPASLAIQLERSVVDVVAFARHQSVTAKLTGPVQPPLYEIEFQHAAGIDPLLINVADGTASAAQMEGLIEEILELTPREGPPIRRAS